MSFTCSGRKGRSEPEKEQKLSRERGYFEIATAATPFGDVIDAIQQNHKNHKGD
jgi:hypothetical protein